MSIEELVLDNYIDRLIHATGLESVDSTFADVQNFGPSGMTREDVEASIQRLATKGKIRKAGAEGWAPAEQSRLLNHRFYGG